MMGMTIASYITAMYLEQVLQRGFIVPWISASYNLLISLRPYLPAHFHHIKSKQMVISQHLLVPLKHDGLHGLTSQPYSLHNYWKREMGPLYSTLMFSTSVIINSSLGVN